MNFAHAFWSKPLFNKKFSTFEISLANTLLDYAYSVACVHKFGHTITLYGDKEAIDLLSCVPYDNFVEIDVPENESFHFAASMKFYALQKMNLHDILIDGDIFLESPVIFSLLKNAKQDIVYSFYESSEYVGMVGSQNDPEYFKRLIESFQPIKDKLQYEIPEFEDLSYPNTSCVKLNSMELKNKWIWSYFKHKDILSNIDFKDSWPDLIIEQYMLGEIINDYNYSYKEIIQDYPNETPYVKKLGFTHLGSTKTQKLQKVRQKLYTLDKNLMTIVLTRYKEIVGKDF